ncbi:MAG: acyl-CoA dehydrogenase [Pseudomonadota bacterium]
MSTLWLILISLAVAWGLAYFRSPLWLWFAAVAAALAACTYTGRLADPWLIAAWSAYGVAAALLLLPPLRRLLISNPVLKIFRHIMPAMSQTEREALEAGTVWWEAELFSGAPRWRKLVAVPPPSLSAEEQAFLDGPVEELCAMLNDWQITHELHDLPPEVWRFIKAKGFFGMIIPKRHGGLEFSAQAHSAVVTKIGSRSITAAVTVMVPNSLGPAELLIRYGSDAQKNHYLPRLAKGEEVPCFALTSTDAGSDAAAMPDRGFVCRGQHNGREVLGMRVTWDKRYITLGPVATVLGLAFRLFDPERLLGGDEDVGITLALIPAKHPGVRIGTRHNPLDIPFQNGPNSGDDVFIPMDFVIGGAERVGQGWRMLMDCLAAGRSISLPALSCGAGQLTTRAIGAYARVRKQFKLPIGKFEGVEEALARIGGYTYIMDAARTLTARALDLGEQPAVASAIVKYHLTELMRRVVNDGMDVQGGAGICLGPQNLLGRAYQALPISITVEGANILTRTLIIYGQGATRCHPWVRAEMEAVADSDDRRARKNFDRALFGHMGFTISNALRALWLGVTGARLVRTPFAGPAHRHAQKLTRLSTAFALLSDAALLTLGGALKRKEKLSGRLADALSYLYLASAVIKRFEDDGRPADDRPLLDWACHYCLNQTEKALVVILKNFPSRFLDWLLGGLIFPAGRRYYPPTDRDGHAVASLLLSPSATRDRLTAGIFQPRGEHEQLGRLELALAAAIEAEPHERKLHRFLDGHPLLLGDLDAQIREATRVGVLTADEGAKVRRAHERRGAVVRVDDFAAESF